MGRGRDGEREGGIHMDMKNRGFTVFLIAKEIINSVLNLQSSIKSFNCYQPLTTFI
jgi:hypothetical protein